jgi:putative membrane protein
MSRDRLEAVCLGAVLLVLAWSMIHPYEWLNWLLEVMPVLIGIPALWLLRRNSLRFTSLLTCLLALHMIVLIVGGHYSYARVPLFDWIRDAWHLSRNHYDRVGHFIQGFVPAFITREVILRKSVMRRGKLLSTLTVAGPMMVSAVYEIVEWLSAVALGSSADDFLGTQGDPFDTDKDMFMALLGAMVVVWMLQGLHDRFLARESGQPVRG